MKKFLVFTGGFVAGVIVIILISLLINLANQPNDGFPGLTVFSEKGECISTEYEKTDYDIDRMRRVTTVVNEIEIFQVLAPNVALATTGDGLDGILVLLVNYDGESYYDDQKIKIPAGKCTRQIGTYQYTTESKFQKTVPAVVIE
ncbi:MAG: hypothetical protein LBV26_04975 [Bacteroidales bacterium]|jgi:hypothetical protein|nr:hypothetical protein [Bacteroidales bacterium]